MYRRAAAETPPRTLVSDVHAQPGEPADTHTAGQPATLHYPIHLCD
jgi:hypothetical protein